MDFNDYIPSRLESLSVSEIAAVDDALPPGCNEVWSSFAYGCFLVLRADPKTKELSLHEAASVAVKQVYQLAHDVGGDAFYFPSGFKAQSDKRAAEVVRMFTGNNHAEVAKKLGVTVSRVRQILRAHAEKSAAARRRKG